MKLVNNNNEGVRTAEQQPRLTKLSYARALKVNTYTFKKENLKSHNKRKSSENIKEGLESLRPANRRPHLEIIW